MNYFVYILYSERLGRYYTGFTTDIEKRLHHHNSSQDRYSKKGVPWVLVKLIPCPDKRSALDLEKQIKSRGAKRYLEDGGM